MSTPSSSDLPQWSQAAKAKLDGIPFFVRAQARTRIEAAARAQAVEVITVDLVEQVRLDLGQ